ncbi:MAG: hypothetical protein IT365_04600 [Candidatus Hydrogenedentes bacterium]|nr:hypothetical protein [Candidatus Hydrogenedentota bacterium]
MLIYKVCVLWSMKQQTSTQTPPANGTQDIIGSAFATVSQRKLIRRRIYLDDENLSDGERVAVLQEVFHRGIRMRQIERLAKMMAPLGDGHPPPHVLIYGPTGTGKSVTCLHFLSAMQGVCAQKDISFQYFYVDLTTPHTCFGAFNELAIAMDGSVRRYRKGVALTEMQECIIAALNALNGVVCMLIDEPDTITRDQDTFLMFLAKTLPRKVQARLVYIFLTNQPEWERSLDPRILSVLKKQDMIFEPYDAMDLLEILKLRVEKALDPDKVNETALRKIAAMASRDTGDARKAVELLAKAAEAAEEGSGHLSEAEVDTAALRLESDKTRQLIDALAPQQHLALRACYYGLQKERRRLSTGLAYAWYHRLCSEECTKPLTQRRFSEMVSFLDLYGLVNACVTSKGRFGKTRDISQSLPSTVVADILGKLPPIERQDSLT